MYRTKTIKKVLFTYYSLKTFCVYSASEFNADLQVQLLISSPLAMCQQIHEIISVFPEHNHPAKK